MPVQSQVCNKDKPRARKLEGENYLTLKLVSALTDVSGIVFIELSYCCVLLGFEHSVC